MSADFITTSPGRTYDPNADNASTEQTATVPVVRTSQIVLGVFLALWLFAVTSGIAWFAVVHILRATGDIGQ